MRRTAEAAQRSGRAFTRTEILAVVSVLVVLAALAVPSLVDARKKALRDETKSVSASILGPTARFPESLFEKVGRPSNTKSG